MKIKTLTMGIIIFCLIFGGIGATIAIDLWTTISDKTPSKINSGEFEGNYNPADIRGSYTFEDVSKNFEIDLQVLFEAFGIPLESDGNEIQTKDLETIFEDTGAEIGNESVQIFVAFYKNLPITLDDTLLPEKAIELILEKNKLLTDEQIDYLETHKAELKEITDNSSDDTKDEDTVTENLINDVENNIDEESENVVNGTATFQKVLDAGVTKAQIEEIINAKMPPTNQTIKDYCVEAGLSFSEIKEQINLLVD